MTERYRVICAWCGRMLRSANTERTSHGMCAACAEKQMGELSRLRRVDRLDMLPRLLLEGYTPEQALAL